MNGENEYIDHLGSSLNAKDLGIKVIEGIQKDVKEKMYNYRKWWLIYQTNSDVIS